jgi:hypothetical protein
MLAIVAALGLAGCSAPKKPVDIAVTLLLRTNETDAIPNGKLTVIVNGERHAVVTDATGHASFMAHVPLSKRVYWQNIGFTPFSWPMLSDAMTVAAELDQSEKVNGRFVHYPVLYRQDILRLKGGDCVNPGARVFGRDANGKFTIDLDRPNAGIPLAGKMVGVPNNGYRMIGSYGDPATEKPLKLDLEFVREKWAFAETAPQL